MTDDTEGTGAAYRPILVTNRLTYFHHSPIGVDGYGMSGGSYGTNVCCHGMGIGCYSVRIQS